MITLRIISATNLPSADLNGLSDPYIKVYAKNFGHFSHMIGKTKTMKKTLNPNWDEYIRIPFVIFDTSLKLSVWNFNALVEDDSLGEANIFPSIQNFYRNDAQVQIAKIDLAPKYKGQEESSLQYSFIPTITNFDFKKKKNPKKIYVYLSFDKFQPNAHENIHLLAYGMNKNGTLVDPIYDVHTEGEIEASHISPSGIVQVYTFTAEDLQESGLYDMQYFFVLKATNFTGKVTLTFLASSKHSNKKDYIDSFFIIDNQYSINITNQADQVQFFYAFPVILKFSKAKCQIDPFQIPASLQSFQSPSEAESLSKIDNMTISIGQLICPKNKLIHRRFEITKFARFSLSEAFKKCQLNPKPSKIEVSIGWDTHTDLDLIVFQLLRGGRLLDPVYGKRRKTDASRAIKSSGDSSRGASRWDDETTTIDLGRIGSDVRCVMIGIRSAKGIRFDCVDGVFVRIVDAETKKEAMFMRIAESEAVQGTGLLWGVLGRLGDEWSVWTCYRFFNGMTVKVLQGSLAEFVRSGEFESIFTE